MPGCSIGAWIGCGVLSGTVMMSGIGIGSSISRVTGFAKVAYGLILASYLILSEPKASMNFCHSSSVSLTRRVDVTL